MRQQIEPNKPSYLERANTTYLGTVDGVLDGRLYGWCHKEGWLEPIELEVFADEKLIGTVLADRFREDLADLEKGNGHHGFFFDIDQIQRVPDSLVRVRVRDTVYELRNSNRKIGSFKKIVS
jgi:hypothetical protein